MIKTNRAPIELIEIENGTKKFMPILHALRAVDEGRAVIANGRVRFHQPAKTESAQYSDDTGAAIFVRQVKPSAGFSVLQYDRRYAPSTQR